MEEEEYIPKRRSLLTEEQRFDDKLVKSPNSDCWLWQGTVGKGGQCLFTKRNCKLVQAGRYAWERTHGPLEAGIRVGHTCLNRRCMNPAHLYIYAPGGYKPKVGAPEREMKPNMRMIEKKIMELHAELTAQGMEGVAIAARLKRRKVELCKEFGLIEGTKFLKKDAKE
jgi:hypothetical protein